MNKKLYIQKLKMTSLENVMLKIKKKNYIQERKNKFYMDEEIKDMKTGVSAIPTVEQLWRGKTKAFLAKTQPEENFYLKEVLKKYQTNQDELKGYNYKYVLELSDLLGQKDKNFSKKRLELYNLRIEKEKKQYAKTNGKFIEYQTTYRPKRKFNYFMDFFDKRKKNNFLSSNKGNALTMYNKTMFNNGEKNNLKKREQDIYYRTFNNYNSSNKLEKNRFLYSGNRNNKYKLIDEKNINNILTEYSNKKTDKEEDSFDTTSLVGKEDFLANGDKERYHEYLSKEYNFFNQAKLIQIKYLFDKKKRINLFKKLPNAKYLTYKKDNPLRIELFNKINREKQKLLNEFPHSMDKQLYLRNKKKGHRKKPNFKYNKDFQNILAKLKKKLGIE